MMIDQAIDMLGPIEKVKGNPIVEQSVQNVKQVIENSKKKPDEYERDPCKFELDGTFARLTGQDPYALKFKSMGGNLFVAGKKGDPSYQAQDTISD